MEVYMRFSLRKIKVLISLSILLFLASCTDNSQVKESESENLAFTNFDASDYFPRPGTLKEFEHAQSNGGVKSKEAVSNHIDGIGLKSGEFVIHKTSAIGDVINESTIFYRVSKDEILNFHTDTSFSGELKGERLQLANKPNWTVDAESEATITAMDVTVETPAGVFENCIEVSIMELDIPTKKYYAPNIGLVSSAIETEDEFLTTEELTYLHIPPTALEKAKTSTDDDISVDEKLETSEGQFLIPDSHIRELTQEDIRAFSLEEIKLAKNEIFARHGYIFNTESIQQYFDSKSWYEKDLDYKGELSEVEAFNVNLLEDNEKNLGSTNNKKLKTEKLNLAAYIESVNKISMEQIEYSLLHQPTYEELEFTDSYGFAAVTPENILIVTDKSSFIKEIKWNSKEKVSEEILYNIQCLLLSLDEDVSYEEVNEFIFEEQPSKQSFTNYLVEFNKSENGFSFSIISKI